MPTKLSGVPTGDRGHPCLCQQGRLLYPRGRDASSGVNRPTLIVVLPAATLTGTPLPKPMGRKHVEVYIRREKRDTRSTDDQIKLSHAMWEGDELPSEEGVTRSDAEDEWAADLDHNVKTCLRHLEEINIVEEFREPGPDTYVIAEWHDETFIMGMVDEAADEGVEALIDHVQDEDPPTGDDTPAVADGGSVTLRQVVARQFDLRPDAVERHLRSGDQVEKLNEAIEGIEEHDEFTTRDDYGEIRFLKAPYQYRLTEFAVDLYRR